MCIRDSIYAMNVPDTSIDQNWTHRIAGRYRPSSSERVLACLLYTSDAADERSSVDLGGRRIIKKKHSE